MNRINARLIEKKPLVIREQMEDVFGYGQNLIIKSWENVNCKLATILRAQILSCAIRLALSVFSMEQNAFKSRHALRTLQKPLVMEEELMEFVYLRNPTPVKRCLIAQTRMKIFLRVIRKVRLVDG